ncbi:MAG TPA: hypothetical protein VKX17_06970 [Planctomycetota bacterium]|nr:hypothetical protein [Planctomycetota bacterium]
MRYVRLCRRRSPASFASYLSTAVSMLNACDLNGFKGYVDLHSGPDLYRDSASQMSNMWDWFFLQPQVSLNEITTSEHQIWIWEETSWQAHCQPGWDLPWNATTERTFAELRRIVSKHLLVKEEWKQHAASLFRKYEINPETTIAIAHRGTDKHREAIISPIERYFSVIDRLLLDQPSLQIWAQPEEATVFQALKWRYPKTKIISEFYTTTDPGLMADITNPKSGFEKARDAVTMMVMFSRCSYLLKNCANLSDLATGLSNGTVIHID